MFKDEYEALDTPVGFGDSIKYHGVGEGITNEEDWI